MTTVNADGTPQRKAGIIYKQISLVMKDMEPIAKSRFNEQQRYKFRGIDDIYNEIQDIMAKHGVFTVPTVISSESVVGQTKAGSNNYTRILTIDYAFFAEDGSSVTARVVGESSDMADKATNKAMSAAHKYCLLQVFCIPTEDPKDSENDQPASHVGRDEPNRQQASPQSRPTQQGPSPIQPKTPPPGLPPTSTGPVPKGFNKNIQQHQIYLSEVLNKRNIPPHHWDEIANKMHGRVSSDMDKVITEYMDHVENIPL